VRARSPSRSEHRRQTDDARRVSGAVAAVDVVRGEGDAAELLRREVDLVRRLRAAEDADALAAALGEHTSEALGRAVERLVPRGRAQASILADERLRQTCIRQRHHTRLYYFAQVPESARADSGHALTPLKP